MSDQEVEQKLTDLQPAIQQAAKEAADAQALAELKAIADQLGKVQLERNTTIEKTKNSINQLLGSRLPRYLLFMDTIQKAEKAWEKAKGIYKDQYKAALMQLKADFVYDKRIKFEYRPGTSALSETKVLAVLAQLKATPEQIASCYDDAEPAVRIVELKGD